MATGAGGNSIAYKEERANMSISSEDNGRTGLRGGLGRGRTI